MPFGCQFDRQAQENLGPILAEMALTELLDPKNNKERSMNVMERTYLDQVQSEQKLAKEGVVDTGTAEELGKKFGAGVAIVGTVTEFGMREDKRGGGGIVGIVVGGATNKKELRIKMDARLIDVRTGKILQVASAEGKESDHSFLAGAGALVPNLGVVGGVVGGSKSEWMEGKVGKAARKVIADLVAKLIPKIPNATAADIAAEEAAGLPSLSVVVSGFDSLSRAKEFTEALKGMSGVTYAERESWKEGVLTVRVQASAEMMKNLAEMLETNPTFKPFKLKVKNAEDTKITATGM